MPAPPQFPVVFLPGADDRPRDLVFTGLPVCWPHSQPTLERPLPEGKATAVSSSMRSQCLAWHTEGVRQLPRINTWPDAKWDKKENSQPPEEGRVAEGSQRRRRVGWVLKDE